MAQLIDIEEELNKIFTYSREETQHGLMMLDRAKKIKNEGGNFSNILVDRHDIGFTGRIHFLADFGGKTGKVLVHYTAAEVVERENKIAEILPDHYMSLRNTAFNHNAVLMNCLAYMQKVTLTSMKLIQMSQPDAHGVNIKPVIAECFLAQIRKDYKLPDVGLQTNEQKKGKAKAVVFDRNQTNMFK